MGLVKKNHFLFKMNFNKKQNRNKKSFLEDFLHLNLRDY